MLYGVPPPPAADVPEVPAAPSEPLDPDEPVAPAAPSEPEEPELPEEPLAPELPDEPEVPLAPELPDEPEEPFAPEEPLEPEVPVSPTPTNLLRLNETLTGVNEVVAPVLNLISILSPTLKANKSVIEKEPFVLLANALEVVVVVFSTPFTKTAAVKVSLPADSKV